MERRDIPVESLKEDEFGIEKYVRSLCTFIKESDTPITISLQGEWGSGKTSFMKLMEEFLCSDAVAKEERYEAIWLNTWDLFLENDYENAVKKLVLNLLEQMEEHFEKLNKQNEADRRKSLMRDYLRNISGAVLNVVNVEAEYSEKLLERIFVEKDGNNSVRRVKKSFEAYVKQEVDEKDNGVTDQAFLIFVDDLDRLEPKMAVTLLEALKNLFDIQRCVFVLAIDYDVVTTGITQKYGKIRINNRNIEQDFFDKLIQVPYTIPMARYDITEMVIGRLKVIHFFSREYDYDKYEKTIIEIIRYATNKNPRAIKRLMNMIHLMLTMEDREEEKSAIFRMMELLLAAMQLSFPKVYRMISKNCNLDTWKKYYYVSGVGELTKETKEIYDLDDPWKEIIYCSVPEEVEKNNFYRIAKLLEIYEQVQNRCIKKGEQVEEVLGIVNVIARYHDEEKEVQYDGGSYDNSSQTQFKQGERLIDSLDFNEYENVLDVGCGNGRTTLEMWNKNRDMKITAFDLSGSQIAKAKEHYAKLTESEEPGENGAYLGHVSFVEMNALELAECEKYDLIFSNATLHWITESEKMYSLLYRAMIPDGKLAVHQGGFGTYRGLHEAARKAIKRAGLSDRYKNWIFPVFYPTKEEMEEMLEKIGFTDIQVNSIVSDEKQNEKLVENFANASLIFYKKAGISEEEYVRLEKEYFAVCREEKIDKYAHRLYIYAKKPIE